MDEAPALATAAAVRDRGYAAVYDQALTGVGCIAIAIPIAHERNLVVSVGGPTERIQSNELDIAAAIREAVRKHNHELPPEPAVAPDKVG